MSALAVLWFFLIFVLIAGYFVLDGFDLGVGVLYRALAKTDAERALVRRSIGPVWDGNEVWLLTAGGALFAAFPAAYATTFSGFYLAVMLVLFGLIVRAVSLEFGAHDPKWGRAWDACFTIGSFLPALLLGVALGNVIAGVPLAANGDYAGVPLLGLLSPFTLVVGALGFAMCMAAGAAWVALKTERTSAVHGRAEKQRRVWHVGPRAVRGGDCACICRGETSVRPGHAGRGCDFCHRFRRVYCGIDCPGEKGQRSGRLRSAINRGGMLGGVGCGVVVPEFGCCGTRQRGRIHYAHERRVVRCVARMDDGHCLHRRAVGAGVPRDRLSRVQRAHC